MEKGYLTIQVLKAVKAVKLAIKTPVDPQEFFQTRDDLYVYSGFGDHILSKAKKSEPKTYSLESFDLVRSSKDEEIEQALGKEHLFDETEVCAIVAELVSKQPKGKKGTLQNNGYANLFYTGSFVVRVYWSGSHWLVNAWDRDGGGWPSGYRVFSPAN